MFSKVVLKENVDPFVSAAQQSLVVSPPPQVVNAEQQVIEQGRRLALHKRKPADDDPAGLTIDGHKVHHFAAVELFDFTFGHHLHHA